jgi:hypothetical protein
MEGQEGAELAEAHDGRQEWRARTECSAGDVGRGPSLPHLVSARGSPVTLATNAALPAHGT